ncbi:hypothetical protein HMPREF9069_01762 [Atopobium sp. oral taxon 810 str. F0209]|nr:hypothetical protein HMPREF9069_01762 [Atopobium sp. oral taxon 810 str. F0209]
MASGAVQSEAERGFWQAGPCCLKEGVAFGKQNNADWRSRATKMKRPRRNGVGTLTLLLVATTAQTTQLLQRDNNINAATPLRQNQN